MLTFDDRAAAAIAIHDADLMMFSTIRAAFEFFSSLMAFHFLSLECMSRAVYVTISPLIR